MSLTIDIAAQAALPEVRALDLSMFAEGDLLNLILQRSEVLFDMPRAGQVIRAWKDGDERPIRAAIARLGPEIARRAAGVILAEYRSLAPVLLADKPRRIADIGCGYALFDLFAARDTGAELVLIDLEENEHRHFGFANEGAAYSNLGVARKMLEANGVAPGAIATLNPLRDDLAAVVPVDLAVSFLSCGFHFPVSTYAPFFHENVASGGAIMVDLRAATAEEQARGLEPLGVISDLPSPNKARRILLRKPVLG
jgi:SAM-dependent methyltransferase